MNYLLLSMLLLYGCTPRFTTDCSESSLACINFIDREGTSVTVQSEERLKQYASADFLTPQPYEKVLRTYKKDSTGNAYAYVTTYHENGQPKQYLEVRNAGAYGSYREWHENGVLKMDAHLVGGSADVTPAAQRSWQFDGPCRVWNDEGELIAEYPYDKGSLEGIGMQYYPNGVVKMRSPYSRNFKCGLEERFYSDGSLMASANWQKGELKGEAVRYWPSGTLSLKEHYDEGLLVSGLYYNCRGNLLSEIILGDGQRAIFDRERVKEFQEYREGLQEGEVKVLNAKGEIERIYHSKNNLKEGQETVFYPAKLGVDGTDVVNLRPQLLISWHQGKIHGITKTWYQNGSIESQREMADNRRNGLATAWYRDGGLMLMEEYDHDRLVKGEYYKKGQRYPESLVKEGCGVATLYDSNGLFLRRINYYNGSILD